MATWIVFVLSLGAGCGNGHCLTPKGAGVAKRAANACIIAVARGQLEKARNWGKLALRYNPRLAEAHNCLGLVEVRYGNKAKAIAYFKKALYINSHFADARNNLGFVYFLKKDYKRARYLFKTALDIDPSMTNAGYNMARTLVKLRQWKKARDQSIQSLFFAKNRRYVPFHYLLGFIEFERKAYKRAIKHWLDCLKLQPNHTKAHISVCKALFQLSQFRAACFHCLKATKLQPRNVEAQRSLKTLQSKLRQTKQTCR